MPVRGIRPRCTSAALAISSERVSSLSAHCASSTSRASGEPFAEAQVLDDQRLGGADRVAAERDIARGRGEVEAMA
jgi:hypothetical protein